MDTRPPQAIRQTSTGPSWVLVAGLVALVVAAIGASAFLALRGRGETTTPSSAASPQIIAAVDNVDYFVGTNLAVGAYRQSVTTPDCYYRVTHPITGELIEESLRGAKGPLTVNLGQDVKFRSTGCGAWVPSS